MKWEELPLADRAKLMAAAVKNGYTDIRSIKQAYANFQNQKQSTGNMYSKGGDTDDTYEPEVINPLDNLPEWKALENIDYVAIPDPEFTREKTGAGSIEYFSAEEPEGITYNNGYHRNHPMPGKDVILYNPNDNDAQDIRLDALHIMPKDPTYDALNTIYRNASLDARDDNYINAIDRYTTDKAKQATRYVIDKATGKDTNDRYYGTDPFMQYFNNEADGTLRSLLMEGDENYRKSKRYWGNKDEVKEWNAHLMPYINDIQRYLETGERPPHVLPNLEVTDQMAYGGNLFDKGGKKKSKGSSTVGERMSFIEQELVKRGVSPVQARAVAANVMVESGGNPQAYNKSSGARGLAQWLGTRKPKSWSMEDQLDYLAATCNKLGGNEWINKAAWKRFNETNDPAEAARLFRRYWERPEASSWYATDKYFGINSKNSYLSDDVNNLVWKMSNLQYNKPRTVTFTKEDQKLLDTSPLQFVKPDYDNEEESSKRAARQKELDNFANSIMLNEDLYKPSNVDNLAFLLNTLGGGTPQSPSDSYNWFTSLLTSNPKATPQQQDNAALYQLFAPYGDGGQLYHGLNFAAYDKSNKFGKGGPYNDEFMEDHGYRWVPASEILLSDPYFNDIQQHNPNGTYAVDKNGLYIPASRLQHEWNDYKQGLTVVDPKTYAKNKYEQFTVIDDGDLDDESIPITPYRNGIPFNVWYNHYYGEDPTEAQYIDDTFDTLFNEGYIINQDAPDITVKSSPYVNLYTYPIGGVDYPFTGHSEIQSQPFTTDNPVSNYGLYIDRRSDSPNYSLFTDNCATSTRTALNDIFGTNFEKTMGMDLPNNVMEDAKTLPGARVYNDNGVTRVAIPVPQSRYKNFLDVMKRNVEEKVGNGYYYPYYESLAYGGEVNKFGDGGPLIQVANKFGDGGFYKLPEWKAWYRSMNTDTPYSNYEDAIDMDDSLALKIKQALDKGVSNCTLTVSQFFNPNRPIARARTIVSDPIANGFYEVDEDHVVPGTMVIASHPDMKDDDPNQKYHTMIVSGFAPQDDVYEFRDGTLHEVKKGEPFVNYSRGKSSSDNYVFRVPLSVYNKKSEGKTRNRYYRPIDQRYPEVMLDNIDVVYKK